MLQELLSEDQVVMVMEEVAVVLAIQTDEQEMAVTVSFITSSMVSYNLASEVSRESFLSTMEKPVRSTCVPKTLPVLILVPPISTPKTVRVSSATSLSLS